MESQYYSWRNLFVFPHRKISENHLKDKTGSHTFDVVYIKDNNSVAVSSGRGSNRCISIIDIESQEVMSAF
jgi:hypothetical protein